MTAAPTTSLRPLWLKRSTDVLLVLLLCTALFFGYRELTKMQARVAQQQARVAAAPEAQVEYVALQQTLTRYRHDLERVTALLLPTEAVGDFVGQLEQAGAQHRLTVRVPDIKEEVRFDANRQPIPNAGPFQEVRLNVVAIGNPSALLQFLHTVEHLPAVVRIMDWQIVTRAAALTDVGVLTPPSTQTIGSETSGNSTNALLEATLIITLRQSHE